MTPPLKLPDDHAARLEIARGVAVWELGDDSWADLILAAYFNPDEAQEQLDEEMAK